MKTLMTVQCNKPAGVAAANAAPEGSDQVRNMRSINSINDSEPELRISGNATRQNSAKLPAGGADCCGDLVIGWSDMRSQLGAKEVGHEFS